MMMWRAEREWGGGGWKRRNEDENVKNWRQREEKREDVRKKWDNGEVLEGSRQKGKKL
jgi:hypothetical protein